jgi:hypothetical protein
MKYIAAVLYAVIMAPAVVVMYVAFAVLFLVLLIVMFGEWGWNGGKDRYGNVCSFIEYLKL